MGQMSTIGQGAALSKKARRKAKRFNGGTVKLPSDPVNPWDYGADGQANRVGMVKERVSDIDGTGTIKRARRVDMLEVWHKRGKLSAAAFNVAERLRNAYEATQKTPATDYEKPLVDATPKPDHAVAIMVDRASKVHDIAKHISRDDWPLVSRMVMDGLGPEPLGYRGPRGIDRALAQLNATLEAVSDKI